MKKQVVHVSVHQTSKVVASLYALIMAFVVIIPMSLYTIFNQGDLVTGLILLIVMPFLYWILFYVGHVISLWLYNIIAKRLGGVEFELKESEVRSESTRSQAQPINPDQIDHL